LITPTAGEGVDLTGATIEGEYSLGEENLKTVAGVDFDEDESMEGPTMHIDKKDLHQ
jgi:hypothetical protein